MRLGGCAAAPTRGGYLNEVRLHFALQTFFDLVGWRGGMHRHECQLRIHAHRLGQGWLSEQKALVKARKRVFEGRKLEHMRTATHDEKGRLRGDARTFNLLMFLPFPVAIAAAADAPCAAVCCACCALRRAAAAARS